MTTRTRLFLVASATTGAAAALTHTWLFAVASVSFLAAALLTWRTPR